MNKSSKPNTFYSIGYISIFLCILCIPATVMLFSETETTNTSEKRTLSERPEFTTPKDFTQQAESYFNDHFGLRSTIISCSNFLRIHLFRSTPKPELNQFGKDGFLFFTKKDDGIVESYTHTNLFTQQKLAKGLKNQTILRDTLNQLGIDYELVVWPNKHTIYRDKLPESLSKQIQDTLSLTDQVVAYFTENHFPIIDVRKDLLTHKKDKQLYYKLDTHWNSTGAYLGYKAFCNQTFDRLGLTPFKPEDFKITKKKEVSGDLIEMMGVSKTYIFSDSVPEYNLIDSTKSYKRIYPEGIKFPTIVTENINAPKQETLLVFRDSYTTALVQFFSLHYKKVIYIWSNPARIHIVHKYNPDVVISGTVERYLPPTLLP